ncbi:DUF4135 domain-containing protein [Streptomyces albidoflavus]|uniref:DUF4135 domain-containing protein n=1 Tax=Streptomyces albidoflavus TaxID=1886 RepID=UPI00342B2B4D
MSGFSKVESMSTYFGAHRVLVNEYLNGLYKSKEFDLASLFDKKLANAFAIHVANKVESYVRQTIEAEVSHVNEDLGVSMTYEDFLEQDELYLEFLSKYESLQYLLDKLFADELENFSLVKGAFVQSLPELLRTGFLADAHEVSDVFLLGDESHDGNKNVALFYVRGCPAFALKLRDLELERKTSEFLGDFFKDQCDIQGWEFPEYISGQDFGWVKWCDQVPLKSQAEVENYYKLAGYLIAAVASLGVTDLHYENIVTHHGNPVPVDLEAVFHHVYVDASRSAIARTGLVPNVIKYTDGLADTEHAGIGNIFRKEIVRKESLNKNPNAVVFDGCVQNPMDYIDCIVAGCVECYKIITAEYQRFVRFFNQASNFKNRMILRDTANYCLVIEASFHPLLLKSNEGRKNYIESCLGSIEDYRAEPALLKAEVEACFLGDVPRFTSSAKALFVCSVHAVKSIKLINYVSGYDSVRSDLHRIVNDGYGHEIEFLKCVYKEAGKVVDMNFRFDRVDFFDDGEVSNCFSLDTTSASVKRAAKHMLYKKSPPLLFTSRSESYLELTPVGFDLFSGSGGLGYLASTGGLFESESENKEFLSAYYEMVVGSEFLSSSPIGGAYVGGLSSIAPIFIDGNPSSISAATDKIVTSFYACEYKKMGSGLVYGLAGALVIASCYFELSRMEVWRDVARSLFDVLVARSELDGEQIIFPANISRHAKKILSGLSHGQAGVAYSIAVYALVFDIPDGAILPLIKGVIMSEINCFDPQRGNWPDLRSKPRNMELQDEFGWAYGGAGIIYVLDFLKRHFNICMINEFLQKYNVRALFEASVLEPGRKESFSVSNGALGVELIYRRLFKKALNSDLESKYWSIHGSATLGCGLMKGSAGECLALKSLMTGDRSFPLLPHELFKLNFQEVFE